MTVTIQIRAQGLDQTRQGLQEIVALQNQLIQSSRAARGNLSSSFTNAGRAATQATSGFRQFSESIRGVDSQLSEVQQRVLTFRQANVALANSLRLPVSTIRQLNQELGTLPNQTAQIVARFTEFRNAGASAVTTFRQLNQEFGVSAEQFSTLESTIQASTASLGVLAVQAGVVARTIQGIFAQGLQDFIAFDNVLRTIQAISGQTSEELVELEDEILNLGASTQFSNTQVATAAQGLLRLGFSADEVEASLGGIVDGARASGESLGTVSRIVATTINQFDELEPASASAISDVLSATANNSATSVSALGQALSFVGTEANSLGQSAADTATIIGLIADAGIPAGRAGRNLARALSELREAAAENTQEFQTLGISLTDASGEFIPLLDLIPQIRENLEELDGIQQGILLQSLFGTEGARAFRAILATSNEEIEELRNTVVNSAGAAAAAGETLTTGLGGALSLLEASTETASATIGSVLAPAAEAAVRAATTLVSAFNSLPAPIQAALVGITGFTGVISAAIASIAAYTAANQLLNLSQTQVALQTVATTAATAADTVVKAGNTAASLTLSGALGILNTALGTSVTAFTSAAAGAGSFVLALAPLAGIIAGIGAAIATTTLAISRFNDAGDELREGTVEVSDRLQALAEDSNVAAEALENLENTDPIPTDVIDRIVTFRNELTETIATALGFPEDFLRIPTNAEKRFEDIRVAIFEAREEANELSDASLELAASFRNGLEPTEENLERATALQEAFNAEIAEARNQLAALDEEELGTAAYIELTEEIQTNIDILARQRDVLEGQANASRLAAAGVEDVANQARLTQSEIQELTEALEEQRDQLRENAEEEFRVQTRTESDDFRESQRRSDRAFQEQLQSEQESFEEQLRAEEEAFNIEQQRLEREFNQELENEERQLQQDLQNSERAFNQSQESARRNFEQGQQALRRQFEDELADRRAANEAEIEGARREVERTIQLEEADTDTEREDLQARFENEDRIAERRAELLAPVLERERQLQEELRAEEEAFAAQEEARALAFQQQQEIQREAFEVKLTQIRENQEAVLEARREAFEQNLANQREQLEAEQQARREVFENSLELRREDFATRQRQAQRDFEDQQRAAERDFREEQRSLDEASAARIQEILSGPGLVEEIKSILESTEVPSTEQAEAVKEILEDIRIPDTPGAIPGFRSGGVTPGGVVKVGEGGPELAALPKGSRVLTNKESRQAAVAAMRSNQSMSRGLVKANSVSKFQPTAVAAQPIISNTPTRDTSPLLNSQLQVMRQLSRTQNKTFAELNRVRRTQSKALVGRNSRDNGGSNDNIDILLGGLL